MSEELGELDVAKKGIEVAKKIKEVKTEKTQAGEFMYKTEVGELVDSFDFNFVNAGSEHVAVTRKGKPEKVIALAYCDISPSEVKRYFYRQRILEALFPHNFPHFSLAFSVEDETGWHHSGSIRQKVDELEVGLEGEIEYPFEEVKETCKALSLPVRFDEKTKENVIVGADGGEYYVDTIGYKFPGKWDVEKIMKYMEKAKNKEGRPRHGEVDKRMVRKSIDRLEALEG